MPNVVGQQQARAAHMTTFATIVGTKITPTKAVPIQKVGQARREINRLMYSSPMWAHHLFSFIHFFLHLLWV